MSILFSSLLSSFSTLHYYIPTTLVLAYPIYPSLHHTTNTNEREQTLFILAPPHRHGHTRAYTQPSFTHTATSASPLSHLQLTERGRVSVSIGVSTPCAGCFPSNCFPFFLSLSYHPRGLHPFPFSLSFSPWRHPTTFGFPLPPPLSPSSLFFAPFPSVLPCNYPLALPSFI